jgi:hypothetical protein
MRILMGLMMAVAMFLLLGCNNGPSGGVKITRDLKQLPFSELMINIKSIKAKVEGKTTWYTLLNGPVTIDFLKMNELLDTKIPVGKYEQIKFMLEKPLARVNGIRNNITFSGTKQVIDYSFEIKENAMTSLKIDFHLDTTLKPFGHHGWTWTPSVTFSQK